MKPFKAAKLIAQKARYRVQLKNSLSLAKSDAYNLYAEALEQANKLSEQASALVEHIAKKEDTVANRADRKYGGWNVWRHDKSKLAQVMAEMDDASAAYRLRHQNLLATAARLREPYHARIQELEKLYARLLRTAE